MPDKKSGSQTSSKRKEPTEPTKSDREESPKKSKIEALPQVEAFLDMAKPLKVVISNESEAAEDNEDIIVSLTAKPTKMSTGSYGWSTTGKAKVKCGNDEVLPVQISINIVVPGSKNIKQDEDEEYKIYLCHHLKLKL
ncbi:hypothetical protein K7432_007488 [Basidiobolus ranarum]|uniref:Uncharacterized protein n=1 Tax=Basidiobolus ranarum TaxID=34480 RepID=A0ABR2W006_9FUNG